LDQADQNEKSLILEIAGEQSAAEYYQRLLGYE
jgi:hypothetical protein